MLGDPELRIPGILISSFSRFARMMNVHKTLTGRKAVPLIDEYYEPLTCKTCYRQTTTYAILNIRVPACSQIRRVSRAQEAIVRYRLPNVSHYSDTHNLVICQENTDPRAQCPFNLQSEAMLLPCPYLNRSNRSTD